MFGQINSIAASAGQSPPVDTAAPYSTDSLRGKTIVITGGASGFGAAFSEKWARAGAQIIIGDINEKMGLEVLSAVKSASGSDIHHFFYCDVTSWESQADFFRKAVEASATGGIDAVVPNAGIAETQSPILGVGFECPVADNRYKGTGVPDPRQPRLAVVDVNITGVLYTVHLGLYWMAQNPAPKDHHILLISSIAGLVSLPGQALYTASKHAVTGLFRALRGTAGTVHNGLRVNMLCPYFVETGILPGAGRALLAGGGKGRVEDVVDAGTRLMSDHAIKGRALVIGPRMLLGHDGTIRDDPKAADLAEEDVEFVGVPETSPSGAAIGSYPRGQAVWECYANDLDTSELFVWRFVKLLNAMAIYRGWLGVIGDLLSIFQTKPAIKKKTA
ncbi:bacilysin biosynthesis oxidoreductase [Ophiostoma piceae UAMH 11346]|uniref:Bacilysin biosynthesis oxidoreductase n=1 Tax=Ophiostoma piceae (strain UAMH 11346) TaxID=1262450 RepID=S3C4D1_OPHP1|nr:bacilysin biosynthesis oxidoreductase [Ophiostoma piceae UAMH 11346]